MMKMKKWEDKEKYNKIKYFFFFTKKLSIVGSSLDTYLSNGIQFGQKNQCIIFF
jgi:hypothetical protein